MDGLNGLTVLFLKIAGTGLKACPAILVVLLVRTLMRPLPKSFAYALWVVVAFRLVMPVSVSSGVSIFNIGVNINKDLTNDDLQYRWQDMEMDRVGSSPVGESVLQIQEQEKIPYDYNKYAKKDDSGYAKTERINPVNVFAVVWLAVAVSLVFYSTVSYAAIRKRTRYAVWLRDNVYECGDIRSPFVFGMISPRIYIPFRLSESARQCALMHEQYHIRRRDYMVKSFAYALAVAYWFHPLVWVSFYLMCTDMEMSCDEKVISGIDRDMRKEYGRLMLAFAANKRRLAVSPPAFGEENTMKRVKNILNYSKPARWKTAAGVIMLMVTMAACGTDADKTAGTGKITGMKEGSGNTSVQAAVIKEAAETTVLEKMPETAGIGHREAQWAINTMMDHEFCTLDYADHEMIIFHISSGLFQYDLNKKCITASLDLQALGCQRVQTGGECHVKVYHGGNNGFRAVIEPYPYSGKDSFVYDFTDDKLLTYDTGHLEGYEAFDTFASRQDLGDVKELNGWRYSTHIVPFGDNIFGILYFDSLKLSTMHYKEGSREWTLFDAGQATMPELLRQDDSFYESFVQNSTDNEAQCILEYTAFYNAHDYAGMCALSTGLEYSDELQKEWGTHTDFIGGGKMMTGSVEGDYCVEEFYYYPDMDDKESDEKIYITVRYIEGKGWRVDGLPSRTLRHEYRPLQ